MTSPRETTVAGHRITLTARDQYNDYSVVYDYTLEVAEPGQRWGRTWALGTDKARAMHAYARAIAIVADHGPYPKAVS